MRLSCTILLCGHAGGAINAEGGQEVACHALCGAQVVQWCVASRDAWLGCAVPPSLHRRTQDTSSCWTDCHHHQMEEVSLPKGYVRCYGLRAKLY